VFTPTSTALVEGALALRQTLRYQLWELVHDVAWSPEGSWFAVAAGESVYLYDGVSLELWRILGVGVWVGELAFVPREGPADLLALVARDGSLQVWDIASGNSLVNFSAHAKGANSLSFSPNGQLVATAGNDAILRLWDAPGLSAGSASDPLAELIGGAFAVPAVRFSPDGGLLAAVDLQSIRLRDPITARLVRTLRGGASIFALAFEPHGAALAAAESAAGVRLWDIHSGEELLYLQAEPASAAFLWAVAFNPDGARLAASSSQGGIYVWSFPEGKPLAAFRGHSRAASAVAFSPDGRWLATGGLEGVIQIWQAP
jgi:WD40 repeat protein